LAEVKSDGNLSGMMQQLFTDQMHAVPEATNSCDAVSITMMVTLFVCFFAAYLFI